MSEQNKPTITISTQPGALAPLSPSASAARERAIAALEGRSPSNQQAPANTQETPVLNPNKVAPEEMSALQTPETKIQANKEEGADKPLESKPEVKTEADQKDSKADQLSAHYAQLARKEKAIRAKAQEIRAKEEAIRQHEAAVKAKESSLLSDDAINSKIKERMQKDPIKALSDAGWSYEQITNLFLNQPNPEEIVRNQALEELRAETKAVRDQLEAQKQAQITQQQREYKQAIRQIGTEVQSLVSSDPAFETIKETRSERDVLDLIVKTFEKDGHILSVEEAAQAVEDFLVEEGSKIARLKKIQQRLKPAVEAEPAKAPEQPKLEEAPKSQSQLKTLTNAVGASRNLSSRERAILAFKGELKS